MNTGKMWFRITICIVLGLAVLTVVSAAPMVAVLMHEYLNTDLPGNDYKTVAAPVKEDCRNACYNDKKCMAATWVHTVNQAPSCWLKNAVPPVTPYPGDMTRVMHSYIKETTTPTPTQPLVCLAIGPPDFTADPTEGTVPLTVHFIDNSPGTSSVLWDWGDGSTLNEGPQSGGYHTYTAIGKYTAKLTVYNACGQNASGTKDIFVNGPEIAEYGSLWVDTTPAGAVLYIDGNLVGTTPVQHTVNLTAGVHRIRISIAGYNDYTDDVEVNPGQEFNLNVMMTKSMPSVTFPNTPLPPAKGTTSTYTTSDISLKKALKDLALTQTPAGGQLPGTGTLIVSSNPAGANVYIDGKSEGKTPRTIPNVTAGQHSLLLTLQGYTDTSRAVNVSGGADNQVAVDMTAAKKTPGFAAVAGVFSVVLLFLFRKRTG